LLKSRAQRGFSFVRGICKGRAFHAVASVVFDAAAHYDPPGSARNPLALLSSV
jgi:hypothetical protein